MPASSIGLALIAAASLAGQSSSPHAAAVRLLQDIRTGAWDDLYSIESPSEKKICGLTKEGLATLFQAVSHGVPNIADGARLDPMNAQLGSRSRIVYSLHVAAPCTATDLKGANPPLSFFVREYKARWYCDLIPLVDFINLHTPGTPQRRWAKLADAMAKAGVVKLVFIENAEALYRSRLMLASEGKLPKSQMFVREPTPTIFQIGGPR